MQHVLGTYWATSLRTVDLRKNTINRTLFYIAAHHRSAPGLLITTVYVSRLPLERGTVDNRTKIRDDTTMTQDSHA